MKGKSFRAHYNRKSRIASSVFFFIFGFGYAAWAARIPTLRQDFHLSDSMLGSLLFAMPVGLLCTLPLTNYLLGRYTSRSIMLFGSLASNAVLFAAGFADSIWQLFILLFCFGSSRNLFNLSMNANAVGVQKLFTKSIITSFHAVWSVAGFAGAALSYAFTSCGVGIRWHFAMVSVAMSILTIYYSQYILYERPKKNVKTTLFKMPERPLLRYAFIVFICMACENTMYDWSGVYFQKTMHASQSMATAAFSVYMIAMTTGRFFGDRLVNKIGASLTLYYCAITLTTGFALAVLFPNPAMVFLGFLLCGFGVSCVSPLVFTLAGRSVNLGNATALASISTLSYMGFLMVPPLIGFISEGAGIRVAFAVIGALAAVMIGLVSGIRRNDKKMESHVEEALL
ncbi:MAG: MFS transporter [Flavobacterium sp.]|nr:MAG: MFS transporter [Flavobacterium sp.]